MSKSTKKASTVLDSYADLIPRHAPLGRLASEFCDLVADQQHRLDNQQPVCPVPLFWVALAEAMGLKVDIETGRIVDGPRVSLTAKVRR